MRAAILERKVTVANIEYHDGQISNMDFTALARRNGLGWRHLDPLHSANLFCLLRLFSLSCKIRMRRALTALAARAGTSGIVPRNDGRRQRAFLRLALADSAVFRIHVRLMPH